MTELNIADAIYSGTSAASAVYLGENKIWPSGPVVLEYNLVISLTPRDIVSNAFTGAAGLLFTLSVPMTFNRIGGGWWGEPTGPRNAALLAPDTETIIAQATINMLGDAVGDFYWATIPEVTLAAGTRYIIWIETGSDDFMWLDQCPCTVANGSSWYACYGYNMTDFITWAQVGASEQYYGVDLAYFT